jgi:heme iron utilization protein
VATLLGWGLLLLVYINPATPVDAQPMENAPHADAAKLDETALEARRLVRRALKASLATLDHETGHPYPSLVLVATEPDGSPILMISRLALHTRNLEKDPRAALLIDGTDGIADPLSGARVTVSGTMRRSQSATAVRRFVARHPSSGGYSAFPDFAAYTLTIAKGHFIGGFGRIVGLGAEAFATVTDDAAALIEGEPGILEHMNSDHADAVSLYATQIAGMPAGDWRMVGIDRDGCDLLHRTNTARIEFPEPVHTPGEARMALVALVQQAREHKERAA